MALIATVFHSSALAQEWVTLRDKSGNSIEARVFAVDDKEVTIERKRDNRTFTIPLDRLSSASVELARSMAAKREAQNPAEGARPTIPADLPKRLYPRSLAEIIEGLDEIQSREVSGDFDEEDVAALRLLNSYRYLSGVPADVTLDHELTDAATDAANACKDAGKMGHDLGRSTDKCNLHGGSKDTSGSIRSYINDGGGSNREARIHRRWCLNYPMKRTGFGTDSNGKYRAMYVFDESGKKADDPWSYPGPGLFPLKFLEGNAWTLYLPEYAPPAGALTVEVFKLNERPEKPFGATADIPGEKLPVGYVSTHLNAINFEPQEKRIAEPGIFWVRIRGEGVREQYLVELFQM